jgi:K+-sensing histidine kinase KdpD
MTTIYRNYQIAKVGDLYVAKDTDDECLLVSSDQQRLNAAIDDLWKSLERGVEPAWFSGSSAINLDTFGPESAPSDTDPPAPRRQKRIVSYPMFCLTALLVSAPLSYFMETLAFHKRVDVMLAIGVCAVAVAFGRRFALMASVISALVFNFFVVEPLLAFTVPTWSEVAFLAMNVGASLGIPKLLNLRRPRLSLGRGRIRHT